MILKAKERGNAPQLARYLLAMRDNEHVELHDVRGFISDDLVEAFGEADAIARGTRCEKHLFSMSFNPPEGANASIEDF
ncbi:MAG: relaxase, partial [Rhodobacterales bacterium]|nr:relaxase [Rhodobacterales bacterium]MDX5391996.1 relaxase [Rhodobacterales bacterium]MDX5491687.1 relaxase [Rhodobacterales bacterium]